MSRFDDDQDVPRVPDERLLAGEAVPEEPGLTSFVAALRATGEAEPPAASAELLAVFARSAPDARADDDPAAQAVEDPPTTGPAPRSRTVVALRRGGAVVGVAALAVGVASGVAAATGVAPAAVQRPVEAVAFAFRDAWRAVTGDEEPAVVPAPADSSEPARQPQDDASSPADDRTRDDDGHGGRDGSDDRRGDDGRRDDDRRDDDGRWDDGRDDGRDGRDDDRGDRGSGGGDGDRRYDGGWQQDGGHDGRGYQGGGYQDSGYRDGRDGTGGGHDDRSGRTP